MTSAKIRLLAGYAPAEYTRYRVLHWLLNKKIVSLSSICFYLQRIQEIVSYHNPEQPLFLYMAFQNVHNPIQAPEEYVKKYDFIDQRMRRVHAGMVDILDEAVGNITKAFKDKG